MQQSQRMTHSPGTVALNPALCQASIVSSMIYTALFSVNLFVKAGLSDSSDELPLF